MHKVRFSFKLCHPFSKIQENMMVLGLINFFLEFLEREICTLLLMVWKIPESLTAELKSTISKKSFKLFCPKIGHIIYIEILNAWSIQYARKTNQNSLLVKIFSLSLTTGPRKIVYKGFIGPHISTPYPL